MEESEVCANFEDSTCPTSKKRKREKPNRKWSGEEVCKILDFLLEHKAFEVPTAQIFYRKMSDVTAIQVDWNLLRWKVRNMRTSYQKAVQWQNSTGAGLTENDSCKTIDQKISKMCPNFDKLQEIFGSKQTRSEIVIESTDDDTVDVFLYEFDDTMGSVSSALSDPLAKAPAPLSTTSTSFATSGPAKPLTNTSAPATFLAATSKSMSTPSSSAKEFADKMKKSAPKSAISRLSALQSERIDVQAKKLDFEREKYKEEKDLAERKLKLEEEKFQLEKERQQKILGIEGKKLQIEEENKKCELKLRQEELAMKERIARYELELKYEH